MILLLIIVEHHFLPKIVIMTGGQAAVPGVVKVAGGTQRALSQTSTACTSMGKSITEECNGTAGKIMNLSSGLR